MASIRVSLPPFEGAGVAQDIPPHLIEWLNALYERVGEGPFLVPGYSISDMPPPEKWGDGTTFSSIIFVGDADRPQLCYSDGTQWLQVRNSLVVV